MKRTCIHVLLVIGMTFSVVSSASAEGPIELGGKTAITANFGLTTLDQDDLDDPINVVILSTALTRTTASARFEYGVGLTVFAALTDGNEISSVTPSAQFRINSNLLGPEENIVVFAGILGGVTVTSVDIDGVGDETDEVGAFGPKFGAEYYVTSNFALQLEDTLTFDTDDNVTNVLAIGVKLLF